MALGYNMHVQCYIDWCLLSYMMACWSHSYANFQYNKIKLERSSQGIMTKEKYYFIVV